MGDLEIAGVECAVAEEWTAEDRSRFGNHARGMSKPELLRALRGEQLQLQRMTETRAKLERTLEELAQTELRSGQFEQGVTANKSRLRGSSMQLVKEERTRLWYKKTQTRLQDELIQLLDTFEELSGKVYLHGGVPLRDSLDGARSRIFAPTPRTYDKG